MMMGIYVTKVRDNWHRDPYSHLASIRAKKGARRAQGINNAAQVSKPASPTINESKGQISLAI